VTKRLIGSRQSSSDVLPTPERDALRSSDTGSSQPSISAVILSDVRFVREALVEIFERSGIVRVLGLAAEFDNKFERCVALRPEIILIDAVLPGGIEVAHRIRQLAPWARVVAFALAETEENVVAWAEAGISGYIPRSTALCDVVGMLQRAMRDEQICSSRVVGGLMRRIAETHRLSTELSKPVSLTRRELEIVELIDYGLSNKEIARRLHIEVTTTKSHVHNVLRKLGLEHRGQAAYRIRQQARTLSRSILLEQSKEFEVSSSFGTPSPPTI
jgi:two-component system nitrate/nitrite response regulator NarL